MPLEQATTVINPRLRSARVLMLPGFFIYGAMIDPATGDGGIPCLWRLCFGLTCPGCGLSRAVALLGRGQFDEAVAMNWMVLPVVLIASYSFAVQMCTHFMGGEPNHG